MKILPYWNKDQLCATNCSDLGLAWVNDAHFLVLACGADEAAIVVPADAEDHVWVQVIQGDESLTSAHVPDQNHVITS